MRSRSGTRTLQRFIGQHDGSLFSRAAVINDVDSYRRDPSPEGKSISTPCSLLNIPSEILQTSPVGEVLKEAVCFSLTERSL